MDQGGSLRASAAAPPRITDSPRRRALLAALMIGGGLQAFGAALAAVLVKRALDGAVPLGVLAAGSLVAAAATVALRGRVRGDAARLSEAYVRSVAPAVGAGRLAPSRRWVAALARLVAAG